MFVWKVNLWHWNSQKKRKQKKNYEHSLPRIKRFSFHAISQNLNKSLKEINVKYIWYKWMWFVSAHNTTKKKILREWEKKKQREEDWMRRKNWRKLCFCDRKQHKFREFELMLYPLLFQIIWFSFGRFFLFCFRSFDEKRNLKFYLMLCSLIITIISYGSIVTACRNTKWIYDCSNNFNQIAKQNQKKKPN